MRKPPPAYYHPGSFSPSRILLGRHTSLAQAQTRSVDSGQAERRRKPRLAGRFVATVHGVGPEGEVFCDETLLENVSAGGLFFLTSHRVGQGSDLLVVCRFTTRPDRRSAMPVVAVIGRVVRVTDEHGGLCGVGLQISDHYFL